MLDDSHGHSSISGFAPPVPESIEETGLSFQFLLDLTLKTAAIESTVTTGQVAERLRLPLPLVEQLLQHLYREKLLEARGAVGLHSNRYALLDRGWEQLRRVMEISGYAGPAPVSLNAYSALMRSQAQPEEKVGQDQVALAFSDLVPQHAASHCTGDGAQAGGFAFLFNEFDALDDAAIRAGASAASMGDR